MNRAEETTDPIKVAVSELRASGLTPEGSCRVGPGDREAAAELAARREYAGAQEISDDDAEAPWAGDQAEFETFPAWDDARTTENAQKVKQAIEGVLGSPSGGSFVMLDEAEPAPHQHGGLTGQMEAGEVLFKVEGERPSYDDLTKKMEDGTVPWEVVGGRFVSDAEQREQKRQWHEAWHEAFEKGKAEGDGHGYVRGYQAGETQTLAAIGRKYLRSKK